MVRRQETFMTQLGKACILGLVVTVVAPACAPRHAATTWPYSRWYERYGAGELGGFEADQRRCLQKVGAGDNPASVTPNSPEEDAFLECMNAANWCTDAFHCNKPGA
jgi:hypothetical protein